jgi:hypothetical protein
VRHAAGIPAAPPPDPDSEVVTIAEAATRLGASTSPRLAGRRVEVRISERELSAVALDTGGWPAATAAPSPST